MSVVGLHASAPVREVAGLIAWNWFFAYGILASRTPKQFYGIDDQVNPRQSIRKYGENALLKGKLNQAQMDRILRFESASANSTEGFILFTASILFALVTNVKRDTIIKWGAVYSMARVTYGAVYVLISDKTLAQIRGVVWWVCNASCLSLLWAGAQTLDS